MATRRLEDKGETATFDHGAQFFTARDERFQAMVRDWCDSGLAREWFRGQNLAHLDGQVESETDGHPRFCATRGMSSIAKHLAQDLDVQTAQRVTKLEWRDDAWTLHLRLQVLAARVRCFSLVRCRKRWRCWMRVKSICPMICARSWKT